MSMELILAKARELGEMLAESEAFTSLEKLENAAMEDAELAGLYGGYSDLREQLQALDLEEEADSVAADNLRRELDELEGTLTARPEIKALEEARERFGALMDQVNQVLQIALQGEDMEAGCDAGGCAGCQGCDVR